MWAAAWGSQQSGRGKYRRRESECQALFSGYNKETRKANRRPGDGGGQGIGGRGEGRTQNAELSTQRGPSSRIPNFRERDQGRRRRNQIAQNYTEVTKAPFVPHPVPNSRSFGTGFREQSKLRGTRRIPGIVVQSSPRHREHGAEKAEELTEKPLTLRLRYLRLRFLRLRSGSPTRSATLPKIAQGLRNAELTSKRSGRDRGEGEGRRTVCCGRTTEKRLTAEYAAPKYRGTVPKYRGTVPKFRERS